MAQKTGKEETDFKVPETITLCVNNCGVIGNPATNNMCQNCFTAATATTSAASISTPPSRSARPHKRSFPDDPSPPADPPFSRQTTPSDPKRLVNRCSGCRRKVGLTGFRCRCGLLFCAHHRYSDRHDCSYDYKAAAREAIARENPVIRAAKIVKRERERLLLKKMKKNLSEFLLCFKFRSISDRFNFFISSFVFSLI
ncbi:hypothetical protein VNO78_13061 [Psophocarpus tetragonolobus]|uniref:Uncharacterized protein n=1 Tax=Psophocarpus tetragonolobus TaxID=3891 RepID=A0AAN9XPM3_PSOTE